MQKTTVYLPDDLRVALRQAAANRGCSEADLIRHAIRAVTLRAAPRRPRLPLFESGDLGLAGRVDKALAGFGES